MSFIGGKKTKFTQINQAFYFIFNVKINDIKKTIPAKVILINPEIEPISQTVKIIGAIDSPDSALRPGMTGQAIFNDNPEK